MCGGKLKLLTYGSPLIPFSGLVPNEDAPDIIANTFLSDVTEAQLEAIHMGFLAHRERMSIIPSYVLCVQC